MASITHLASASSGANHGTGSFAAAAVTTVDNSLVIVAAAAVHNSGSDDPSPDLSLANNQSLSETSRLDGGDATSWSMGARVWTLPVTTGASTIFTFDLGARNCWQYVYSIVYVTGYNTGSPVGGLAEDYNMADDGSDSITLDATPASDSVVVGFCLRQDPGLGAGVVFGTGWTELADVVGTGGSTAAQAQSRTSSTSTTVLWDDTSDSVAANGKTFGLAIEIKNAAAAASSGAGVNREYPRGTMRGSMRGAARRVMVQVGKLWSPGRSIIRPSLADIMAVQGAR